MVKSPESCDSDGVSLHCSGSVAQHKRTTYVHPIALQFSKGPGTWRSCWPAPGLGPAGRRRRRAPAGLFVTLDPEGESLVERDVQRGVTNGPRERRGSRGG